MELKKNSSQIDKPTRKNSKDKEQLTRSQSTLKSEVKFKHLMMLNSGQLPSIQKSDNKLQGVGGGPLVKHPVSSYKYLKQQWIDINSQTNDRRKFIRDFAKR